MDDLHRDEMLRVAAGYPYRPAVAEALAARIEALEAQLATTPGPEAVAKFALEKAAEDADSIALPMDGRLAKAQAHYMRSVIRDTIRAAASDPDTIAAIIKTAGGKKE
jgi:hypothetical protein